MDEKKKIGYTIALVLLLIIIVVGATYAYFSATAKSDNDIKGGTLDVSLGLSVKKISATGSKSENLIPIYDGTISGYASQLETAAQSKYNCIDKNDYTVCQIYEITISNTGANSISTNTTITFNKNNVNNLKWAGMSDANTVISNNRHTITNNVPDTIASNTIINGKSNNTKLYFMVYVNIAGIYKGNLGEIKEYSSFEEFETQNRGSDKQDIDSLFELSYEQDKDGFSGIITVTATSGDKITATFN